ncbi:MAG: DNA methylase [Acidaminococcaceae bacterium]|nr:DNA methylase [Acidaminococcaceae bacterium]
MGDQNRVYICIDLKSFYASVECVYRGLDPLQARLLVADESRSNQTICLAVSPALKAIGVPSRPRLFEAKQAIHKYECLHHTKVDYIIAVPRMAEYERVSALIYSVYLRYVSEVDIHVYSIDECFLDVTGYMHLYQKEATAAGTNPARIMAMTMIKDVLRTTGITATVGIGTNLYLAKVAMDIVAKKAPADKDGVRIAELNEDSYKYLLWDHKPLTDFWQIGPGKQHRLEKAFLHTMGEIAQMSQWNEEFFFKTFGIDGEILIDHAWGIEPVTMADIKAYKSEKHSVSNGQVLPRPYEYAEARVVFSEMVEVLCTELFAKRMIAKTCTWWVSYDYKSLEHCPGYDGPISMDYYGRLHPRHNIGTVKLPGATNSIQVISEAMLKQFDARTDHRLLYRRLGVCANDVSSDDGAYQTSLFLDYDKLDRENNLRGAMQAVRQRYGANALFRGMNLLEGATALERNQQIGGHRR